MPATALTGQDIIEKFEQYVDDTTELSSQEELDLANAIYRKVLNDRPWFFLQKPYSGTTSYDSTLGLYYVALPSDFHYIPIISGLTDIAYDGENPVVFIVVDSISYQPWKVINYQDRRRYLNQAGYCYIDLIQDRLYFTDVPPSTSVQYDYIHSPSDLTTATSPIFPADFHPIIYHGMAVDGMMCQLFDKARSYAGENESKYQKYLGDLAMYDSRFYMQ